MSGHDEDWEDAAPSDEHESGSGFSAIQIYLLGFVFAVGLTVASFWIAGSDLVWGPGIPAALIALAVAQIGVHLVFFLHITSGPENTNNTLALAFGVLIVVVVVAGSMWIMAHMRANMMPMPMNQLMQMQR
jgi:cytochrome o ubiquinol oxidase operon protein cyoD